MRILFSILANAVLLYLLARLLPCQGDACAAGGVATSAASLLSGGWKTYLVGGVVLGAVGAFLRPFLELVGLPLKLFAFGLTVLLTNSVILYLFTALMGWLNFPEARYEIRGAGAFLLAVAIFTLFNTLYGAFFKRK